MSDIPEGSGDVELALAMEEQVNARVMTVLENLLGMPLGELSKYADAPNNGSNLFLNRLNARLEANRREQNYKYQQQMGVMNQQLEIRNQAAMNQRLMEEAEVYRSGDPNKPEKRSFLGRIFL